jgi:hypothetical protein
VNLSYSSAQRNTGSLRLTAIIDDTNTGKFRDQLLGLVPGEAVTVRVTDAQIPNGYDVAVGLSGCVLRGRVVHCKAGDTRATIKTLRDDPDIFNMTLKARHLSRAQTGAVRPVGPVSVLLQHGPTARTGQISTLCRNRGEFSLSCRMP